jgi:hypothetical protein
MGNVLLLILLFSKSRTLTVTFGRAATSGEREQNLALEEGWPLVHGTEPGLIEGVVSGVRDKSWLYKGVASGMGDKTWLFR